jgi:predicted phage terminase large subunit-like protein
MAIMAVEALLHQKRILYATPTQEQIDAFWSETVEALMPMITAQAIDKNETRHTLHYGAGRIRARTAWDQDSLRGDAADLLILDEFQLMSEDAWTRVGAPMMLDTPTGGTAVFCFTPPSLLSAAKSKARDPRHANKLYNRAQNDTTGHWEAFHFTSMENPHISEVALGDIAAEMGSVAYRQEILAEEVEESGGIFRRAWFEVVDRHPVIEQTVRHYDLAGTAGGGDWTVGLLLGIGDDGMYYILDVIRCQESPHTVERLIIDTAKADGPETIISLPQDPGQAGKAQAQYLIRQLAGYNVHADQETGSKTVRALPVAAQAEGGNIKILSAPWTDDLLAELEEFPGGWDDQVDALAGAFTDLVGSTSLVMWSA